MLTCSKQGLPKIAMVFDDDVDIWDDNRITQCMAFRYMPDRDTLIIPQCNTMSTDPKIGDVDKSGGLSSWWPRRPRARPEKVGCIFGRRRSISVESRLTPRLHG